MRKLAILSAMALSACAAQEAPPAAPLVAIPPPTIWKPAPEQMSFKAIGTEPFWSITTSEREVIYSTPELLNGVRLTAGSGYYSNRNTGEESISFSARLDGEVLVLQIARGVCSDGMSDTVYPYTAKLTIGARTENGCARRK